MPITKYHHNALRAVTLVLSIVSQPAMGQQGTRQASAAAVSVLLLGECFGVTRKTLLKTHTAQRLGGSACRIQVGSWAAWYLEQEAQEEEVWCS
jgi:hypothetical protein